MKRKKWTFIIIAKLIFFLIIFNISNAVAMGNWIFSNKDYQEKISIESYLMNKAQIISLFKSDKKQVQLPFDQLKTDELHLIIRLKNNGNSAFWGTLHCQINERDMGKVNIPILGPNMYEYANFIIPTPYVLFSKKAVYPKFTIEWVKLYIK